MDELTIWIDGAKVLAKEGLTILEAANVAGVQIPTLCHIPDLTPTGVCRICVVEVEGPRTALVGSCHTPITEGMKILTRSPKVLSARKATLELLLAGHTGSCVIDPNAEGCRLHQIASDLEVSPPAFKVRKRRFYLPENTNPFVQRDLSKCILCRRCLSVCNEIAKKGVFSIGYRGFKSKVIVNFDEPLQTELCRDCLICIEYCPTGALSRALKGEEING